MTENVGNTGASRIDVELPFQPATTVSVQIYHARKLFAWSNVGLVMTAFELISPFVY